MSNVKDLSGQRFGRLIAVCRTEQKDKWGKCFLYECLCDCGNTVYVPTSLLKNGNTRSCGCLRKESQRIDITGERYGRLVAIARTDKTKDNSSCVWRFRCDCGNEIECTAEAVMWKGKSSCGCLARETKAKQAIDMQNGCLRVEGTYIQRIEHSRLQKNNTSGVRGVYWHKGTQMWVARIGFKGKNYTLGYRNDITEAAKLRKEAEKRLYGGFLKWYAESYPEQWAKR